MSLKFNCEPGIHYFKLSYKLAASDDVEYRTTATGPFKVRDAETQQLYLSFFSVKAAVQNKDRTKPGYIIEAQDFLDGKMTPAYTILANKS